MNNSRSRSAGIRWIACALMLTTTLVCTLQTVGQAMLAPAQITPRTTSSSGDRMEDMKTIQTALESKIVRERLKAFGLNDEQIQSRLDKLSDQQVHQLAARAHAVNSGGDGDGGGIVIGILFIAVLVLLIIYLAKRI